MFFKLLVLFALKWWILIGLSRWAREINAQSKKL